MCFRNCSLQNTKEIKAEGTNKGSKKEEKEQEIWKAQNIVEKKEVLKEEGKK
jgi:hypothetical protein